MGPSKAQATIVFWGSTKGPIREAMKLLGGEGITVNYLQIIFPFPLPHLEDKPLAKNSGEDRRHIPN